MKKAALFLFVLMLVISFISCPPPETGTYTISGVVKNMITGQGIYNASVIVGDRNASTDGNGSFSLAYTSSASITGGVYVSKGIGYTFWGIQSMSMDVTKNPHYAFYLQPTSGSYPTKKISGSFVGFSTGGSQELRIYVINSDGGGMEMTQNNLPSDPQYFLNGTGYAFPTYTFGSDCLIRVYYDDDGAGTGTPIVQYYSHKDLSSDITLDIQRRTGTTITVNGTNGDYFTADISRENGTDVPQYIEGAIGGSGSTSMEIFNQDGYPMIWKNIKNLSDTPVAGYATVLINVGPVMQFSSPVDIPAAPVQMITGVTSNTAWTEATRTISFDGATGANMYMLQFQADYLGSGVIFISSNSVSLPTYFYSDAIKSGTGWDVSVKPIYSTKSIDNLIDMRVSAYGPFELSNIELNYIDSPVAHNDRTPNLIR